jgi:hypothetical protein
MLHNVQLHTMQIGLMFAGSCRPGFGSQGASDNCR